MKTLAYKEKRVLLGTIVMTIIISFLLGLCIYRLTKFNDFPLMVNVVFIGLAFICLYYLVVEIKNLIQYSTTKKNIIEVDDNYFYLASPNKTIKVNRIDVFRIDKGNIINNSLLFYQNTLIFRTKEQMYLVKNISNYEEVYNNLQSYLINEKETEMS